MVAALSGRNSHERGWAVKRFAWLLVVVAILGLTSAEALSIWKKDSSDLAIVNRRLHGRIVDHTANHGRDNRIWSRALNQKRDLYVYLPPNYNPHERYPIVIFMHGFALDEQMFLTVVSKIDEVIAQGKMPPHIVVVPDGSIQGEPSSFQPGSFFINSMAGAFEDWVLQDVWDFVCSHYPIRPEREAHVLAGVSMGGFAAFNLGIRHRNAFGVVVGIHPPLNLRWTDVDGDYFAPFDPRLWGWRTKLEDRAEVVAQFGLVKIRIGQLLDPLFGFGPEALEEMARQNPIELIDATHLKNGELAMFVGFGAKDEFNIAAQVESFLYLAKCRGLGVAVAYDPNGRHDTATAARLRPQVVEWLAPRLAPYAPK
jgi:S-formylglutathione hydrolase FrmB